jgi:fumarate hydratase, class I
MKKITLWEQSLFELIRRTAVDLPSDVETGLRRMCEKEKKGTRARWALDSVLENVMLARANDAPLCQDSGTLVFWCCVPVGFDTNALTAVIRSAVSRATKFGYLRLNTVDSLSGQPSPTNIAHGSPVVRYEQGARENASIRLLMKGGGSENVGCQYGLPDPRLGADRDLEGVRRCILDAIVKAQGHGCAPGVLGVCIGGDRATGYEIAKEQFLRKLDDRAKVKTLARLEDRMMKEERELRIGPMGLGGGSSLLGVKIGAISRIPACFFVTVSYVCWALRRRGVVLGPQGGIQRWLY